MARRREVLNNRSSAEGQSERTARQPQWVGEFIIVPIVYLGEVALLLAETVRAMFSERLRLRQLVEQMDEVGVRSLLIVLLTVSSAGVVLSLYTAKELATRGAGHFVGWLLAYTIARELGPMVTAIVVAARVGAAFAAEIGTMKVTEQIDALRSLAVDPVAYLVVPRMLACIIMMPALTMLADVSGTLSGMLIASTVGVHPNIFLDSIRSFLTVTDLAVGLIKSVPFGILIAIVSCHQGLETTGGAMGVGRATTNAVVLSLILVYVADVIMSSVLPK
ncbi:MAG: ABC transporter permease [Armatimonadota bacterium]|nr:ABC transporter permease [Armatimonadota bacterium]MCX7778158.1 ABC transporter permease [Armatimonadota bacterium]MDW8024512.1 ABC transporter permease [Armatimonadota bacterium]